MSEKKYSLEFTARELDYLAMLIEGGDDEDAEVPEWFTEDQVPAILAFAFTLALRIAAAQASAKEEKQNE